MSQTMQFLAIVGGILSLATVIAGTVVVARASYVRAQLEQQRAFIADLNSRKEYVEAENQRLKAEKAAAEAERDIAVEMVTQRADLEAHHKEVMLNHERFFSLLTAIKHSVEEVLKNVRKGTR